MAKKKVATKKKATKKVASKKAAPKKTATAKKTVAKKVAPKKETVVGVKKKRNISPQERWNMIAEVAYLKAERRGFIAGHEYSDWMEAEKEIDAKLR